MANFIKPILKKIAEFFQKIEKKKLIMLIVAAVLVIAIGITGAVLLNQVKYTVLYTGLSSEEAGTIMKLLSGMGVTAKAEGTGTILVPEKKADELRMDLASQGYPQTGLNYDIFQNSSSFGSTDSDRQTYQQYQLQENMRATISRMSKVKDCIVIVNLASTSSYVVTSNKTEASVAVLLSLKNSEKLTSDEAKTIAQFVVKCVPNLKMQNVSIVDSNMHNYDVSSDEDDNPAVTAGAQQQLTEQMKGILLNQVMTVVEPVTGKGNIAVSVNLDLNFDKKIVNSVEFTPPIEGQTSGMVTSSQEQSTQTGGAAGTDAAAGTTTNGVSAPQYVTGSTNTGTGSTSKTYNYQLNQLQTQIEKAQGQVQDLSVAVLLNSSVVDSSGKVDTAKIKNLVASAIGVDSKYVTVETMPFVKTTNNSNLDNAFSQNQATVQKLSNDNLIKTIVIVAAVLLMLFMVLKFFKRKTPVVESENPEKSGKIVDVTLGEPVGEETAKIDEERLLKELVIRKSDETERVEELMDRYPEAVVQILRTWLTEDD